MTQFTALTSALSALRSSQTGMDVTSHNIANANTAGYTRQRVNVTTSTPYYTPVGAIGTGVKVADITRIRDTFLDMRLHASNSTLGDLEVQAELLGRTELVLGEPDFGVTKELSELWATFDELSIRPDDNSVRLSVITQLGTVASRIRTVADGLTAVGEDATLQLQTVVEQVNDHIAQLAEVNDEIASIAASGAGVPNDLLDRRDLLVDELSRAIGANATHADNGMARLSLNGYDLVSGTRANLLELQADNTLLHPSGGTVAAGGKVRGFQAYLDADPDTGLLARVQKQLDDFATELMTQVNTQHSAGKDLDGDIGAAVSALFAMTGGASTLTVAITRPDDLAAADPAKGTLDGTNASALAMLRSVPAGGGPILDSELRSIVTDLGARVASMRRQAGAEQGINNTAAAARRDHNAVSLDEEMVQLITFQRAFEAAARVVTAVDEAMQTIVSRLGLVGR